MGDGYIMNRGNIDDPTRLPMFKYTGKYSLEDKGVVDGVRQWKITFRTSGTFTPANDMDVIVRAQFPSGGTQNSGFQTNRTLTARMNITVRSGQGVRQPVFGTTVGTATRPDGFGYVYMTNQ